MAKKITTPTVEVASIASLSAALVAAPAKPQISTAPAEKAVASRATWTGILGFGMVNLRVKTMKATDEEKVSLNQIHCCNHANVVAKGETPTYTQLKSAGMKCPTCETTVSGDDILKGYEYAKGEFVVVTADEMKACAVVSDQQMTIDKFVKLSSIDPIHFADAEYLVPDKGFEETFSTLRKAMVDRGVVAIAQSAQRGREQTVFIRPYGTNGMVIHYMYFDNEVRSCDKWPSTVVDEKKVELAGMLIDMLMGDFDATEYEDSTIRARKGLINDKILGRATPFTPLPAPVVNAKDDIMALLQASRPAFAQEGESESDGCLMDKLGRYIELKESLLKSKAAFVAFQVINRPLCPLWVDSACDFPNWEEYVLNEAIPLNRKTMEVMIEVLKFDPHPILLSFVEYVFNFEYCLAEWKQGLRPHWKFTSATNFPSNLDSFVDSRIRFLKEEQTVIFTEIKQENLIMASKLSKTLTGIGLIGVGTLLGKLLSPTTSINLTSTSSTAPFEPQLIPVADVPMDIDEDDDFEDDSPLVSEAATLIDSLVGISEPGVTASLLKVRVLGEERAKLVAMWGTKGADGTSPTVFQRLKDLTTDHLVNIYSNSVKVSPDEKRIIKSILEDRVAEGAIVGIKMKSDNLN